MRTSIASFLLVSFLLIGWDARASEPAKVNPFETNLQALANFFLPSESLATFAKDACRTAYRTKLQRTASNVELEQAIPGIIDRMVSAAGEHCDRKTGESLVQRQERIKADWRSTISATDLQKFVGLVREETAQAQGMRIDIREGDMASDAAARMSPLSASEQKAFDSKQQKFAASPGGATLLSRISSYQSKLKVEIDSGEWFMPVMKAAIAQAHVAANAYAQEKGYTKPYPGE